MENISVYFENFAEKRNYVMWRKCEKHRNVRLGGGDCEM
jgi:hypothetical protein